ARCTSTDRSVSPTPRERSTCTSARARMPTWTAARVYCARPAQRRKTRRGRATCSRRHAMPASHARAARSGNWRCHEAGSAIEPGAARLLDPGQIVEHEAFAFRRDLLVEDSGQQIATGEKRVDL